MTPTPVHSRSRSGLWNRPGRPSGPSGSLGSYSRTRSASMCTGVRTGSPRLSSRDRKRTGRSSPRRWSRATAPCVRSSAG